MSREVIINRRENEMSITRDILRHQKDPINNYSVLNLCCPSTRMSLARKIVFVIVQFKTVVVKVLLLGVSNSVKTSLK